MSRHTPEPPPVANSSSAGTSPGNNRGDVSESPSSPHHNSQMSEAASEGYPSWLPKRPRHPPPASTFTSIGPSGAGIQETDIEPEHSETFIQNLGGRKPTPRSVRIVSLQESSYGDKFRTGREPTDQSRISNPLHQRVWSRATCAAFSPTVIGDNSPFMSNQPQMIPQPKFNARGLHPELLRNPSLKSRLYFYAYPILVFAHIPLQTFFDFNAVFILFQVSKYPNPEAPGVPGSGRNWALGAAAYIACWLVWILIVFIVYELIYSFARRWRIKHPLILPIYLSTPAYSFAALTSYTNFCFLQHLRFASLFSPSSSPPNPGHPSALASPTTPESLDSIPPTPSPLRQFFAESCHFYSQNTPTVALLLPRAGLSLALLLAFSSPNPLVEALADTGISQRDPTFFRRSDGSLTAYARGVLITNAAWTAWKFLVLLCSWIGLWILSGQACAGLCGPRYRWEEEDLAEKSISSAYAADDPQARIAVIPDGDYSAFETLPWSWRELTKARVRDVWEFCLVDKPARSRWGGRMAREKGRDREAVFEPLEGVEQVLAAVGLPTSPPPARRGVLSEELFVRPSGGDSPDAPEAGNEVAIERPSEVKKNGKGRSRRKPEELPYPFTAKGAQVSSEDERVPFPPSPVPTDEHEGSISASGTGTGSGEGEGEEGEEAAPEEGEEVEVEDTGVEGSEEPSSPSRRASGSMSSLGHPISSRYPFQFRQPPPSRGGRGHNNSHSLSSSASQMSPATRSGHTTSQSRHSHAYSHSGISQSGVSHFTQSTGNGESVDDNEREASSPTGPPQYSTSEASPSPGSQQSEARSRSSLSVGSGIPMPPRHPQQGQTRRRGRGRAGTVPADVRAGAPYSSPMVPTSVPPRTPMSAPVTTGPDARDLDVLPGIEIEMEHEHSEGAGEGADVGEEEEGAEEREDVVGLLTHSAGPSPKASFTALRHRASSTHRRAGSRSGSNSRTNSHSGSSSGSRSRTGSMISVHVRSRTQSLMQGLGAASHSSLELVQAAITRSRANSSMARLEEDTSADMSDAPVTSDQERERGWTERARRETQTHSRNGSGSVSDAVMSSMSGSTGTGTGENYTFGHPLRTQWQHEEQSEREPAIPESPTAREAGGLAAQDAPLGGSQYQSNLSVSGPPSQIHSDGTVSPLTRTPREAASESEEPEQRAGVSSRAVPIPIPTSGSGPYVRRGPGSQGSSQPDISTADASFVTAPATVEGQTTDSGENRTVSSWGGIEHGMPLGERSAWRPA